MKLELIVHVVVIGLVGTLIFDCWNWLLQKRFGIRAPNWAILGRWLLTPSASDGANQSGPLFSRSERIVGAAAHYSTGIIFALVLVLVLGGAWLDHPTPIPALVGGLVTIVFAWFIIMPALRHGIAASKAPSAIRVKVLGFGLISHGMLGLGFYVGALIALFGTSVVSSAGAIFQ